MRTFSLKDDRTLSGVRLHPSDRRVAGGGYIDPTGGPLIRAHGFVHAPVEGSRPGEVVVVCEANLTAAEREAMREMVGRWSGVSKSAQLPHPAHPE